MNNNKISLIRFILNEKEIKTDLPPAMALLDFIRYHQRLTGTKIGCREGDCGACTILIGELKNGTLQYQSATCCLMPLSNANGKHIVTVEGINFAGAGQLNAVQQAMADQGATQCGFCTPGFVMSLAGFCLSDKQATRQNAVAAIDGNICRCTGYKSIERAADYITEIMKERKDENATQFATKKKILPEYFSSIKDRLDALASKTQSGPITLASNGGTQNKEHIIFIGGGTDLYVQKHDELQDAAITFMLDHQDRNGISKQANKCIIGPCATVTDLKQSPIIQKTFPLFDQYAKLVSSTPIRNMATIAGNFINASPIGDFTIFFLALDAQLILTNGQVKKELPLRKLYKGYKQLNKNPDEYVEQIWFELPNKNSLFNFEKVSKRTHLDIASVNSAISINMKEKKILSADISAGGVGPIPMYLQKTSEFLKDKNVSEPLVHEMIKVVQSEILPISDARGTEKYKRLLLEQLIKAHFIKLFPELKVEKLLVV